MTEGSFSKRRHIEGFFFVTTKRVKQEAVRAQWLLTLSRIVESFVTTS